MHPIVYKTGQVLSSFLALVGPAALSAQSGPPATPRHDVQEVLFGQTVSDPYRWLEHWQDSAAAQWFKVQDRYTRDVLTRIPGRQKFLARVQALDASSSSVTGAQVWGGKTFYLKAAAGAESPKLYVKDAINAPERLLVDPERLLANHVHYSIDYFQPSFDGRLVAIGISPGGSEHSALRIVETATGRLRPDSIDRVQFGYVQWLEGDTAIVYNRLQNVTPDMPRTAYLQRNRVYVHTLGRDPEQDRFVFGYGYSPDLAISDDDFSVVYSSPASPHLFAVVLHGARNELTGYVADAAEAAASRIHWRQLFDTSDAVTGFAAHGHDLYVLTHRNHPRSEVRMMNLLSPAIADAKVIVPASAVVIQEIAVARDGLYVRVLDGGVGRLRRVSFDGVSQAVPVDDSKSVSEVGVTPTEDGAMVHLTSWTTSPVWSRYDPPHQRLTDVGIQPPLSLPTSEYESVEVKAKSADGTLVPLSIIRRRGLALDRNRPTLLTGYGAYGFTLDPHFEPVWLAWLERGGVLAIAHVRGGGEYGEEWHRGGYKQTKQHSIDDFIACAQYLIDRQYTSPAKLSGEGRSAGGIVIGGAITRRPDLFAGALIQVGVTNMLRVEFMPTGPGNIPEFGTISDSADYRALYAMDAYQHVKDGVAYPGVLLTAGINDPRVDPWQPGKMTARLQAATSSGRPILLRVDYDAGHGPGSTRAQHDLEYADEMSFLLWQDGDPEFKVP